MKNFGKTTDIRDIITVGYEADNAVLYSTSQSLTNDQKIQARTNIGAGTSSFDGNYNSLSNKPTIPTKTSQLNNDSNFATTSQVEAKYTKPSGGIPKTDLATAVQNSLTAADSAVRYTSQSLTDAQKEQARKNIGAGTSSFSGSYNDLADKPSIPPEVSIVQSTGESTSSVMSQKATTDAVNSRLSKTNNTNIEVLGTKKATTTLGGNQLYAPNGIIFGGTAAAAGLVTRGICGITTPSDGGACSKENLYINYDGNNDFNAGRQLVLNAGAVGNHLGSNMYQYTAPRGEIVKNWVEAKGYVTGVKVNGNTIASSGGVVDIGNVVTDVSGKANLAGGNTFSGVQTINAPTNVNGSEQTTMKVKTSNGGAIIFGKEGANSGTMIRLDQTDGTCRLRFRSSATAGAMVWEQPESGAQLYVDLGARDGDYHRVQFPSGAGTLALTSQIPTVNNGTLTIQQNGTKVATFGANQSTNATANITTITDVKMNDTSKVTNGVADLGTVLTDASKFATSAQGTKADNAMPKSGGTFTGEVKFGNTENFQGYYIKRMLGFLSAGTRYDNLDSKYKDGTYHRMWRLRFPSGSNFWGKIKITLYGNYSSFNASGVMSKSVTCNFNTSNIYNNVGCYDGLGVNVEQDFRISEAIWNATASAWEILIWQKNLSGNNSPEIMLECWTTNSTNYINAFNGIAAQTVELTQSTSYSAQKASPTGGTKTVEWATLPVYENPLGEEIATIGDLSNKANLSGGNTFTGKQTLTSPPTDGYSIDASGYVKGSWLQAPSTGKASSNTDKVCVLDGSGWVYYRTPAEIVSDGGGAKASDIPTKVSELTNDSGYTTNKGTVTGVKINGSTKGTSGVVDLGYMQVRVNGTTYTADSSGLIDIGTISGGGTTAYANQFNEIY